MLWTISEIWNKSIEKNNPRPIEPRAKIWASELGKQDLDVYLKLIGEKPSNDFDSRSLRKFEAGNLFEWIVKMILTRCGVYQESQKWVGYKMDESSLEVSGKIDHLAGGKPNIELAIKEIESLELPGLFTRATEDILKFFQNKYPDGLPNQGIEVKSTSSYGIEKVYMTGHAMAGHDLQAFHYAYNTKLPFMVLYICRDDLRMAEIPILPDDPELLIKYQNKIKGLSGYYNAKKEPPKEPEVIFDEKEQRFSKNFKVEYSSYLKRNYGFDTPKEFDDRFGSLVESWNRIIGRLKEGKEMTKNNLEKSEQINMMGFNFEDIKKLIIQP